MEKKLHILVADDHALVRHGLVKLLFETEFVQSTDEAKNGLEALMKAKSKTPDLLLLDYDMPIYNAAYTCRELKKEGFDIPVLVVSMHQNKEYIMEMIKLGAKGFLPKEATSEELANAIRAVYNGQTWFKGSIAEAVVEELAMRKHSVSGKSSIDLSRREMEIFKLLVKGNISRDIANALGISIRTVEVHKANIYRKLGIKNIASLMQYAIRNNLL